MRRMFRGLLGPATLAVASVLAFRAPLPYFTEQPGGLFGLAERVHVEADAGPLRGEVLFGTVHVRTATVVAAVRAAFASDVRLIRSERLIPAGMDPDAFFAQQRGEFALAADVAAAVGLRAAGLAVDPQALRGQGALVLRVPRGGPAVGKIRPGEVVTAVGERPIGTAEQFTVAVTARPWDPLTLRVQSRDADGRAARREVRVAPAPDRAGRPSLGLVVSTYRPEVALPVDVRVDESRVGGPSAGLAMALVVFDLAAPEDLLRGRRVAVTGSIGSDGVVGLIGGVGLKALAAARAGVDLLLVPVAQEAEARAAAGGSPLRVVGVETFDDALAALRAA